MSGAVQTTVNVCREFGDVTVSHDCESVWVYGSSQHEIRKLPLTLRRRIKSHLLFAGIIRSSPFSLR